MTPLAALSIDLERTAVGLRPPSQATYQALPRHAGSLGRLYPNVNHMGVDGYVKKRALGEQPPAACLHNPVVTFPNEDVHELDVFFLVDDRIPICIECKTGEFRQDIEKYTRLVKRLSLEKGQFLVCAIGLDEQQIQGFNSMYGVTFANETNFLEHVQRIAA